MKYWSRFRKDSEPFIHRFVGLSAAAFFLASIIHLAPIFGYPGVLDYIFLGIDFGIFLFLSLLFLLRFRVSHSVKVLSMGLVGLFMTLLSFAKSGLVGTGMTTLAFVIVLSFVFLRPKIGALVAGIAALIPTGFSIAILMGNLEYSQDLMLRINGAREWLLHSLAIFVFALMTGFLINLLRSKLLTNIGSLEKSNSKLSEAIEEIAASQARIKDLAYRDSLTGLANRTKFEEYVTERLEVDLPKRILLLADIKGFRIINALHGYDFGDQILYSIGQAMLLSKRPNIFVARWHSDEFAIWSENLSKEELLKEIADFHLRSRSILEPEELGHALEYRIAGVEISSESRDLIHWISRASIAMRNAKRQNQTPDIVWFHHSMMKEVEEESKLRILLEESMRTGDFQIVYQKKVEIASGKTIGVEALARWAPSSLGTISPDIFIPILTKQNWMIPFGKLQFIKILNEFPLIQSKYGEKIHVSINISPIFFLNPGFTEFIFSELEKSKIPAEQLVFEITEDIFIDEVKTILGIIQSLRSRGIGISLDDFGKGYSSLYYLRDLRFTELKLDRGFVEGICEEERNFLLFQSICKLAESLGLLIIAEGIESKSQEAKVFEAGCKVAQGYFYAKPESLY